MLGKHLEILSVLIAMIFSVGLVTPTLAQSTERVQFAQGNDNAAIEASVKGREYRDYLLGARAGQSMSVSLITDGSAFFNILPPGSDGAAIFNGSTNGKDATIKLPTDGDYIIRVYLMGNDRDTNKTVPFMLSMTIM